MDGCKVKGHGSVVTMTVHWIPKNEWALKSAVLCLSTAEGTHTGANIQKLVEETAKKYHIEDKLDAITTDNGANFVNAAQLLLEDNQVSEKQKKV
jgi:hypothetical protein